MQFDLICHPETPAGSIEQVGVSLDVTSTPGEWRVQYWVMPAQALRLPAVAEPARADGLWQTTCFELFARAVGGDAYREFNFSPSGEWAAYAFDAYRAGGRDYPLSSPPRIVRGDDGWAVALSGVALPDACRIGLSAVIEERDGTKSYWALRHPPGKPDFHHADCFALELPAPEAP